MGSGDKTEYILGGILAAVILLAIGLTVNHFMTGDQADEPDEFHLQCVNRDCKYEVTYKTKDYPENIREEIMNNPTHRAKCPKCQKNMLAQMDQCPKCKGYYVSNYVRYDEQYHAALEQKGMLKDICPHCKTDIQEYFSKKSK